jgi:hypothetical protein
MRLLVLTFATVTLAFAVDPFPGTWKPNVEKWKLSPGAQERLKQEVITFESAGKDQYRAIIRLDGKPTEEQTVVWVIDGKDHEFKNGQPGSAKWQRIDERHVRVTVKSAKGTAVSDYVVSADNNTLTVTRKGTGATSGRTLDELLIYDRQPSEGK